MVESDPEPFIPLSLNPLISNTLKSLSPDEVKSLNSACMNDPAFTNAMISNNPELANQMNQMSKDAEGSQSTSEAILDAGLSKEQKRDALANSVSGNVTFANKMSVMANELNPDEEAMQDLITKVKDNVDASNNDEAKKDIETILAANMDPAETIKAIHNKDSIVSICGDILKESALKNLSNLDNNQLEQLFNQVAENPAMAKMLAESNPALAASIAAMKDPNTV